MKKIDFIETSIQPLRDELSAHPMYAHLKQLDDVKLFMEQHVFAVWDFMSLLKALQTQLTCTHVPWTPASNTKTARFINEIVLGEETDLNELHKPRSHFEMYLDAMAQLGASTSSIDQFINLIQSGKSVNDALSKVEITEATRHFVNYTFDVIQTGAPHKIASAFTFGREDIIPDMFVQILNQADPNQDRYTKLRYYLDRHIELDGDEHGPLSLMMIEELCGDNEQKWQEVLEVAQQALQHRINLWNGITNEIVTFAQILK